MSNEFQETLVLMTVKGIDNIDDVQNTFKDVNNIYSYYDFRSIILDYDYAFNVTDFGRFFSLYMEFN